MVYKILRIIVNIGLRAYFRKIFISGLERVPRDKPLLIACNHPSGFLEPIIMACTFPKPLSFLVRGDLFSNALLRPLLLSTNQIPIFRFRDGFSSLKKNSESIRMVVQVLRDHKPLLIFVEGSTKSVWKLRPLQKGMGRMAQQTLEEDPELDLHVLPVGITFTQTERQGSEIMLNVGEAYPIRPIFEDKSLKDPIAAFNDQLFPKIQELTIDLRDPERDQYAMSTAMRDFFGQVSYQALPRFDTKFTPFPIFKALEAKLNAEVLDSKVRNQSENTPPIQNGRLPLWVKMLWLVPGFLGVVLHLIPIGGALLLTNKLVSSKEFYSSILIALSMVFSILYYFNIFIITWITLGLLTSFVIVLAMILLGFCGVIFMEQRFTNTRMS